MSSKAEKLEREYNLASKDKEIKPIKTVRSDKENTLSPGNDNNLQVKAKRSYVSESKVDNVAGEGIASAVSAFRDKREADKPLKSQGVGVKF